MRYPAFVGPSYRSQSKIASADRTVNWYPEKIESPAGKAEWVLYPTPGFALRAILPKGPFRGGLSVNGRTFVVGGDSLYELDHAFTVTERGSGLNNIDGRMVTMHTNGDGGFQLWITSGSKGYVYDLQTNTLTQVLDGAAFGGYVDGFFLSLITARSELRISDLMDGSTWDPLQVAQRNAAPDKWISMLVAHKEIWLFGSQTLEVWYNTGASPFPFAPRPDVFLQHGILAPLSAAVLNNAPAWLGQSAEGGAVVYHGGGYVPTRISDHALEYALSTYETLTDAEAWTYQEQGHAFYLLNFPTARATWAYDTSTGLWHERGSWDGTRFVELPIRGHVYANGIHLTGSRRGRWIFEQSIALTGDAF